MVEVTRPLVFILDSGLCGSDLVINFCYQDMFTFFLLFFFEIIRIVCFRR